IEALQRKAGLLRIASRVGRLGAWSVRLPDGELIWSPETLALLEADEQTPPTRAQGWDFYVPAHRSAFRTAFQKCAEEGTPFDLELEIETIRGRHLWVRSMGEAQRDDQNAIIGVHGALQDLSD